jgi:hypothetical protein
VFSQGSGGPQGEFAPDCHCAGAARRAMGRGWNGAMWQFWVQARRA